MNLLIKIVIFALIIIAILFAVYFFLLNKLKNINTQIFKYKEEISRKEKNVLIIYQPSRHKTIEKIVDRIKEKITDKGYGFHTHTLSKKTENYDKYQYVILVLPVYFGEVHSYIKEMLKDGKINNLIVVYNGINEKSNKEDEEIRKVFKYKYSKIKVNTDNIEIVDNFIDMEVL